MNKYKIILHITTLCNYNCSYCNVIKDKKKYNIKQLETIIFFIKNNFNFIDGFKFFGGEPLMVFDDIKYIIDNTKELIGNRFETVTNTSLLKDEIGEYFSKYFERIFLSIDTENKFDYKKVFNFIEKFNLKDKIYFNLIIFPGKENEALKQFEKLYRNGFRNFNILPVYLTKIWDNNNLLNLSKIMKNILDRSIIDKNFKLYRNQYNNGYNYSLINETVFINTDLKVYYSDSVSSYIGNILKKDLYLGNIKDFELIKLNGFDFSLKKESIRKLEESFYNKIKGQKELNKIMDYFYKYLNNKS